MKTSGKLTPATPLLEAEEREFYTLKIEGAPKKTPISVTVTYDDVRLPVEYEIGETPDGHIELTFPVIGKEGVARIFEGEGDEAKLLGKRAL